MKEFQFDDGGEKWQETGLPSYAFPFAEVPISYDILPESGREVVVIGDVERCRELNHKQGENPFGFEGTCGLVSCESVLRQFGIEASESDVVRHAIVSGLCEVNGRPSECGGTTEYWQAQILSDAGIASHAEFGRSISDLAGWVNQGRGVIIEVNAGELWNNANAYDGGRANHAIVLTGAAVDAQTGELSGFYVNDSGRAYPGDSGRFISVELMQRMWADCGGSAVITEHTRAS